MFIAAAFTGVKTWKQPKCLLADEWTKKKMGIYYSERPFGHIKGGNAPGGHYAEWNKPDTESKRRIKSYAEPEKVHTTKKQNPQTYSNRQ